MPLSLALSFIVGCILSYLIVLYYFNDSLPITNQPYLSILQGDGNTSFLRAARAGNLERVLEHLKNNIDINTSNAVS